MMFRPNIARWTAQRLVAQNRYAASKRVWLSSSSGGSLVPNSLLKNWYNTFGKSTAMYASWLVMLIVVGEYATGKITDSVWTMSNYGRTFDTVDWSKFDQFEDEEEEESGDDEEEEEEEEDDDDE